MSIFYLGLGSNQGDRHTNIKSAINALLNYGSIIAVSSVYETEPKYEIDQPRFLNAVCKIKSNLPAIELFAKVKLIEKDLGRTPSYRNGPRLIDIDLLYSPHEQHNDQQLQIPHPGLSERAFVLIPLCQIEPTLILSHLNLSVSELLKTLKEDLLREVKIYHDSPEMSRV